MDAIAEQALVGAMKHMRDAAGRFNTVDVADVPPAVARAIVDASMDMLYALRRIQAATTRLGRTEQ